MSHTFALPSVHALYTFAELLAIDDLYHSFDLLVFEFQNYMQLDATAVLALTLFPQEGSSNVLSHRSSQSLFGLLNRCKTSLGSRKLMQWIRLPLKDDKLIGIFNFFIFFNHIFTIVERRLDIVEWLVEEPEIRKFLFDEYLRQVPDLDRLSKKLCMKKFTLHVHFPIFFTFYLALLRFVQICSLFAKLFTSRERLQWQIQNSHF
jgi:DNA mismatch repair protein MSH2